MIPNQRDGRDFDTRREHLEGLDDLARAQVGGCGAFVEAGVEARVPALVHVAARPQQALKPDGLVEPLEQSAVSGALGEQQTDGRVDNHVRADVLELAAAMHEMTEHRVHQFVRHEAEQVRRARDVPLDKRGIAAHHAVGVDAGCGTILARVHLLDERRHEAVPAKCVSKHFSYRLQRDFHGLSP